MDYLTVPVMVLNGPGLYPGISRELVLKTGVKLVEILSHIRKKENTFAIFFSKNKMDEKNKILLSNTEVYPYGVLATVNKIIGNENDKFMQLDIMVSDRVELLSMQNGAYVNVQRVPLDMAIDSEPGREEIYGEVLQEKFLEYVQLCRETDRKMPDFKFKSDTWGKMYPLGLLVNQVMGVMEYNPDDCYSFLSTDSLEGRYFICMDKLETAIEKKKIKKDIASRVRDNLQEKQKQVVLNEEMNVIKKQLNNGDDPVEEYKKKLSALEAPEAVIEKLNKEISRLERMPMSGAEAGVQMNYIESMLEFPWSKHEENDVTINKVKEILDEDHYGLDKVKEHILEYMAVRKQSEEPSGSIMCLVGPPGTGKTSIAKSIARSLGRRYVRVCLGGVHDEAEIRGHRKTYVGAMPGRIAEAIKQAGVNNPLILLDELDKMGADGLHGNPADAMLEVLDSEQNSAFRDHYMELPIDLSKVLFIATANDKSRIPTALYDRLDMIEVESYSMPEKVHIADKYLIEKQMKKNGISSDNLMICENVIESIVTDYTKEAGVRELERKIAAICRKTVFKMQTEAITSVKLSLDNLEDFLGKPYHKNDVDGHKSKIGVVHGLAWTSVGGVVLDVEAAVMPGKGELILTGKMGDVMKESARIALSLVRSRVMETGLAEDYFDNHSFHIHIPEGAVPKDGPSAGITLSTVLYSVVTNKRVRGDVAMTGEVTLTGRVLAIGGLREKLLAANTDGYSVGIVPDSNRRDVSELSKEILGDMEIHYAKDIDDVWNLVFEGEDNDN